MQGCPETENILPLPSHFPLQGQPLLQSLLRRQRTESISSLLPGWGLTSTLSTSLPKTDTPFSISETSSHPMSICGAAHSLDCPFCQAKADILPPSSPATKDSHSSLLGLFNRQNTRYKFKSGFDELSRVTESLPQISGRGCPGSAHLVSLLCAQKLPPPQALPFLCALEQNRSSLVSGISFPMETTAV